jgi:hypothetical protein
VKPFLITRSPPLPETTATPRPAADHITKVIPPCQGTPEVVRLGVGGILRMDTWDYILAIGAVFVFIFTIVMDVLLVREWIKKRRDKQEPHEPPGK